MFGAAAGHPSSDSAPSEGGVYIEEEKCPRAGKEVVLCVLTRDLLRDCTAYVRGGGRESDFREQREDHILENRVKKYLTDPVYPGLFYKQPCH